MPDGEVGGRFPLDIYCSLFIINFFVNFPTVFTKRYRHFLPQGKNGKKRRKKLRGDKGMARGSLSSGQDIVFEKKMPFTLKLIIKKLQ
jgi:hypothetical protein